MCCLGFAANQVSRIPKKDMCMLSNPEEVYNKNSFLTNTGQTQYGIIYVDDNDFADACRTAVINKRAGGTGLICGRKAFQRPMKEGVKLINTIQDVYLDKSITLA